MKHIFNVAGLLLVAVMVLVAACDSTDNGKQTQEIDTEQKAGQASERISLAIPYITLRNVTGSDDPEEYFGDERDRVHSGMCNVSHTPYKALKSIAQKAPFYIPENKIKLDTIQDLSSGEVWRDLKQSSRGDRPLLYVHGFNISFNKGCRRASMFQENLGLAGRILLFSWPSDGAIMNYTRDEADLSWSVAAMEKTLAEMIKQFGRGGFDVVAHSLGTRGAFLALVRLSRAKRGNKPLLNQLVLIAPDIDADIFKQYLPQISSLARNITIYVSDNDSALLLSQEVHGYPRLGESGPHLQNMRGVDLIDITDTGMRSASGHLYHLYNHDVINDLDQLLNQGMSAAQRSHLKPMSKTYWQLQPIDTLSVSTIKSDMNEGKDQP